MREKEKVPQGERKLVSVFRKVLKEKI